MVRGTSPLPSRSSEGFIGSDVVQDSMPVHSSPVASSSKFRALGSRHDTATPASADSSASLPQSSWNHPGKSLFPASQASGSITNVPVPGTQKGDETEGQSAAEEKYALVPQSEPQSTGGFPNFPNLLEDGSIGLGASTDCHHSRTSTMHGVDLILSGGSTDSISQPEKYLGTPNTQLDIPESVKIALSPPRFDWNQIDPGTALRIPELSATETFHDIPFTWTISRAQTPATASHQTFGDGSTGNSISKLMGALSKHLSEDLFEPEPPKTDIDRLGSLPQSIIVSAHHYESMQWSSAVSQESRGLQGHLSFFSASRLASATATSKHTSAPIDIVPTTAMVQSSITPSSWGRLAHSNELQSATDGRLAGVSSVPQTTSLGDGRIGVFANTFARHTQISSLDGALVSQGTSIPRPPTDTSSEPTTADRAAPTTEWSTTEPPNQLPTLWTPDGGLPDPSTSTNSVHTTASSLDGDSIFDTLKMSRSIPKRSLGISLGTASGALVIFICIFLLHRPCYEWARQRRRRTILVGHELRLSADVRMELLPRQAQNPEISHFSADS